MFSLIYHWLLVVNYCKSRKVVNDFSAQYIPFHLSFTRNLVTIISDILYVYNLFCTIFATKRKLSSTRLHLELDQITDFGTFFIRTCSSGCASTRRSAFRWKLPDAKFSMKHFRSLFIYENPAEIKSKYLHVLVQ